MKQAVAHGIEWMCADLHEASGAQQSSRGSRAYTEKLQSRIAVMPLAHRFIPATKYYPVTHNSKVLLTFAASSPAVCRSVYGRTSSSNAKRDQAKPNLRRKKLLDLYRKNNGFKN